MREILFQAPSCRAASALHLAEDRRRVLEAGFDEHLTKPVDLGTLELALALKRPG
jgi:CheY-like chemotaxis protein